MDYTEGFRDPVIAAKLIRAIHGLTKRPLRLMEVCGTHTVAIFRHGIRSLMPKELSLVSGPGCPVCVTSQADIDSSIRAASLPGVSILTFGDMIRVPGTEGSLRDAMAHGADVKVVYSSMDALQAAAKEPNRQFVFLGIGFETTAPLFAATLLEAKRMEIQNFRVLSMHKLLPPALEVLLSGEDVHIDGLICPGHVSAVTGSGIYEPFARDFKIPCVITGFEPVDILQGIYMLLKQIQEGRSEVEIQYSRVVSREGNRKAIEVMNQVFVPSDTEWRGLGLVRKSGLRLRDSFADYDAWKLLPPGPERPVTKKGCRCGDVLKGTITPAECKMFGSSCTPENPLGPCMVSSEGSCSAYFHYHQS